MSNLGFGSFRVSRLRRGRLVRVWATVIVIGCFLQKRLGHPVAKFRHLNLWGYYGMHSGPASVFWQLLRGSMTLMSWHENGSYPQPTHLDSTKGKTFRTIHVATSVLWRQRKSRCKGTSLPGKGTEPWLVHGWAMNAVLLPLGLNICVLYVKLIE